MTNIIGRSVEIKPNNYSKKEKEKITNNFFDEISIDEAEKEFLELRKSMCNFEKDFKPLSRIGNKTVNYFTRVERLDTKGNKNISFYDFIYNKNEFLKKKYVQKLIKYHDGNIKKGLDKSFHLYYGSINIFKPLIAMKIYCLFKPTSILDFTAGWGGRLIGASVLNIDKYTGIDLNKDIEPKYKKMIKFLKDKSKTKIKMIFKDALKVDYSKIDYDLVLTSPPYFNIEIYKGTKRRTEEEWINDFYEPLFTKTFKHLKKNGWYCLNIPDDIYEKVAKPLFGKPNKIIDFPKATRGHNINYTEKIYCWNKK